MAEIIKFPGGDRQPKKNAAEQEPRNQEVRTPDEILVADIAYLSSPESAQAVAKKIGRGMILREYIHTLRGFRESTEDILLRQAGLKADSLERLFGFINDSGEMEWAKQPSFYLAVLAEIDQRTRAAREHTK